MAGNAGATTVWARAKASPASSSVAMIGAVRGVDAGIGRNPGDARGFDASRGGMRTPFLVGKS